MIIIDYNTVNDCAELYGLIGASCLHDLFIILSVSPLNDRLWTRFYSLAHFKRELNFTRYLTQFSASRRAFSRHYIIFRSA